MSELGVRVYKAASTVVVLNQLARHATVRHVWHAAATLEVVVAQGAAYVNDQKIEALGFVLVTPGREVRLQGLEEGTAVLIVLQVEDLPPELQQRFEGRAFAGRWRETLALDLPSGAFIDASVLGLLIDEAVEQDALYEQRVGLSDGEGPGVGRQ